VAQEIHQLLRLVKATAAVMAQEVRQAHLVLVAAVVGVAQVQ
jgi:hypothetical protein